MMKNVKGMQLICPFFFIIAKSKRRKAMPMPTLEVKCTVSDCFFHAKGNFCGAEKIEINMESNASKKDRTEFASDFDLAASREKAAKSSDTCCKTFISKKDASKHH